MTTDRDKPIEDARGTDRRRHILRALQKCILSKGFTKTSLTDIAVEASMSPSHIRYYYDGKDAILEHYLSKICDEILDGIRAIDTTDHNAWFHEFVSFFIGNPWITNERMTVAIEIFGISVHDERLRHIKASYDLEIRKIIEDYFRKVGCANDLTPAQAAEVVQALEAGLKFNSVFQDGYDTDQARALFIAGVRSLTGAPVSP